MDTAEITSGWRYFDNGGRSYDRYSIWEGDGYLACSEDPFHPQGFGQHVEGLHPDRFGDELEDRLGKEITYDELPAKVQQCVDQDARLYLEAEANADLPL